MTCGLVRAEVYDHVFPTARSYIKHMQNMLAEQQSEGRVVLISDQQCLKDLWRNEMCRVMGLSNVSESCPTATLRQRDMHPVQPPAFHRRPDRDQFMIDTLTDFVLMVKSKKLVYDGLTIFASMAESAKGREDLFGECKDAAISCRSEVLCTPLPLVQNPQ